MGSPRTSTKWSGGAKAAPRASQPEGSTAASTSFPAAMAWGRWGGGTRRKQPLRADLAYLIGRRGVRRGAEAGGGQALELAGEGRHDEPRPGHLLEHPAE